MWVEGCQEASGLSWGLWRWVSQGRVATASSSEGRDAFCVWTASAHGDNSVPDKASATQPCKMDVSASLAAVTHRHKNSVLKQHKFIILQPCRLEVNIDLPGLRLPCLQGCVSFWRLEGRFHCLAFSSFQGPPTFLGSWPLPPSLRPAAEGWLPLALRVSDLTLCYHLPDSFLPVSSTFKDPCDWTGDPPGQSRLNFPF